jgi:hypothetical protein
VIKAKRATQAQQDRLEKLVLKALPVPRVQLARPELLAWRALRVPLAHKEPRVLLDQLALLEHKDLKAFREFKVPLVLTEPPALKVQPVLPVPPMFSEGQLHSLE